MSALSVFSFTEENPVRVQILNQEPWFVALDVCRILGLKNNRQAISSLDDDEKGVIKVDTLGGIQELQAVNESGLYALVFKSRKPEAKRFRKWVTSEVLPSIRKTGGYDGGIDRNDPLNMSHRADIAVSTDRTFRSWMRTARAMGMSQAHAIRLANEKTIAATGVDVIAESGYVVPDAPNSARERSPEAFAVQFLDEWRDGVLDVPYACCASRDLYTCYLRWCRWVDAPEGCWPLSHVKFSQVVNAQTDMKIAKKWFSGGVKACVLLPFSDPKPDGEQWQYFMAARVAAFRAAMEGSNV